MLHTIHLNGTKLQIPKGMQESQQGYQGGLYTKFRIEIEGLEPFLGRDHWILLMDVEHH